MPSDLIGNPAQAAVSRLYVLAALVVVTQLAQAVHGWVELTTARSQLEARLAAQEQAVEEVGKVKAQLESIAGATAKLADQGNANAKALLERLKIQGITLRAAPPKQ